MRNKAEADQRASTPRVGASDEKWEPTRGHLMRMGIRGTIDSPPLPPSAVHNCWPANGSVKAKPCRRSKSRLTATRHRLRQGAVAVFRAARGEVLFWDSEDLRSCVYVFSLPRLHTAGQGISAHAWCPWDGFQPLDRASHPQGALALARLRSHTRPTFGVVPAKV